MITGKDKFEKYKRQKKVPKVVCIICGGVFVGRSISEHRKIHKT